MDVYVMQSIVQILAPLEGGRHQRMQQSTAVRKTCECLYVPHVTASLFLNYFLHLKRAVVQASADRPQNNDKVGLACYVKPTLSRGDNVTSVLSILTSSWQRIVGLGPIIRKNNVKPSNCSLVVKPLLHAVIGLSLNVMGFLH